MGGGYVCSVSATARALKVRSPNNDEIPVQELSFCLHAGKLIGALGR